MAIGHQTPSSAPLVTWGSLSVCPQGPRALLEQGGSTGQREGWKTRPTEKILLGSSARADEMSDCNATGSHSAVNDSALVRAPIEEKSPRALTQPRVTLCDTVPVPTH